MKFTNKKILINSIAILSTFLPLSLMAEDSKESEVTLDVALNSDSFFGFYPTFQGALGLAENLKATFYGILWSGGVGENWGNWTEVGLGVSYEIVEGITVNPQVGFLGGNLLSSGTSNNTVAGDGWVPNLTINLNKDLFEGQVYAGYYDNLQNRSVGEEGTTLQFFHYWANLGIKATENISTGVHWESLLRTGGSNADSDDVYKWLGAYLQLSKPSSRFFARAAAGPDFTKGNDSFVKASVGFGF